MKIRLLFVDEEIPQSNQAGDKKASPYMQYYIDAIALDGDIDCTVVRDFAAAKMLLSNPTIPFDIVSLDVMMPVDVDGGSVLGGRAGIDLLKTIIDKGHTCPVILLSNVNPILISPNVPSDIGTINSLSILEKISTDPFAFVAQVKALVKKR